MRILCLLLITLNVLCNWAGAGQSVIIAGAIDEKDPLENKNHVDIHRIPITKGDFLAALLVSYDSYPEVDYRFHPKGETPSPNRPWNWCTGCVGLIPDMTPRDFIATPSKGAPVRFKLYAPYEILIFSAPQDGVVEMRIRCSKASPYSLLIGKEKFIPVEETIVKGSISEGDPLFETHWRVKDHTLPGMGPGGFMIDVKLPVEPASFIGKFTLTTPDGSKILVNKTHDPSGSSLAIGRADSGDYSIRVHGHTNAGKMSRPMPYEVVAWRIPDIFSLLGIKPASPEKAPSP